MMSDYKEIRKQVGPHIDKKAAHELGKSLIDGFKTYLKSDQAPETVPNGVAAKGIAHGAAFILAMCANRHGLHVSEDMKITFLAYFDDMYKQYMRRMIDMEDSK
jgi:hypothetical protein